MFSPLVCIGASRADDAYILASFRMGYNQHPATRGRADDQEPLFTFGMIRIGNGDRLPIRKNSHRFVEADSVLPFVRRSLPRIPLEVHDAMLLV